MGKVNRYSHTRRVKREKLEMSESESLRSMAEFQKSLKACSVISVIVVVLLLWLTITATPSMAVTPIQVGVILDLNSTLGYMVNNSLALAVEYYYFAQNQTATKINLTVEHVPQNDVVTAASRAYNLMENVKVHAILGPQNSEQARYIVKLGEEKQVPVIWFPITGPSLLPPPSPSSIYIGQGLNCYQFKAIAATIKALGWQSIIPIYEETEYGSHLFSCLTNVLKEMGIQMANVTAIDSNSPDVGIIINSTLDKLNDTRTRVFLVHMSIDFGTEFIKSAQTKKMMDEGYAWILTQELSSLTDPQVNITRNLYRGSELVANFTDYVALKRYMQGALGVRPMDSNKTDERRSIERNFSERFIKSSLTIYGWWAYHTIEALAKAIEETGTDKNGPKLRGKILATNFKGVSGVNFNLSSGQLQQSEFEVYNVISARERIIGSWNPTTGLVQNYSEGSDETSGGYQLKDPLWPGDTLKKPPKLRIGVPRTNSFPEFVNVDNSSNPRIDGGFTINVFIKAVGVLPFPLNNYEFVPLSNENTSGTPSPMYDDFLCSQMKVKDLDAIIGDITIVASRTNCVDFTLPYLDSSVAMVVRVKNDSTGSGILLKPFKWSLWLILGGIFVAATIIIIILENYRTKTIQQNKTDDEFDSQLDHSQNKTNEFLFNPFLVYKKDVMDASSNAGWMVILTSFLFILVLQVYTANLTSILTQGKSKEPLFKDENETKSNNDVSVGYQNGSWVRELLIQQIGFEPSRLKPLGNREEYDRALSSGTKRGGVDAIFDETPYLTLFLSKYKSHYMMTGSMYKTGGFAFAFPKKSGLASHFSTAILRVTQDAESYRVLIAKSSLPTSIEDLEFEDEEDIETSSLSITNFGGLYPVLLSVVALFLCLFTPSVIRRLIGWVRRAKA